MFFQPNIKKKYSVYKIIKVYGLYTDGVQFWSWAVCTGALMTAYSSVAGLSVLKS